MFGNVSECVWVCARKCGAPRRHQMPRSWSDRQVVMSHLMWMLGTEFRSSDGAQCTFFFFFLFGFCLVWFCLHDAFLITEQSFM